MAHPDHDQVIGRLAGAQLRGSAERRSGGAATVELHPDAETWAAYVDGGLLRDEVGSLERHLGACPVCRRFVAALVPEVSTAAAPALSSAEPPASGLATIIPFPRRQVIAWMGIAAGLFGAVTLWSVSRLGSDGPVMEMAATAPPVPAAPAPAAAAPPVSAIGAAAPLREAPAAERDAARAASASRHASAPAGLDKLKADASAGAAPSAASALAPAEEKRADAVAPAVSANARQIQLQTNSVAADARPHGPHAAPVNQQQNAPAQQLGSPVPAPAPPAAAAPAPAAPALADAGSADTRERRANEQAAGQVAEVVTTTGAAGARRSAAARSERGQAGGAAGSGAAASKDEAAKTLAFGGVAFAALPSFAEPGGHLHWRIADGRRLESSSDGGATWRARYTAGRDRLRPRTAPAILRAGTAPAIDSAWAVGERGLVLRFAVPGEWTAVAPPAAVTLVAVSATGAQSARVTAADGRVFETADGGVTWTPAAPGGGPQ